VIELFENEKKRIFRFRLSGLSPFMGENDNDTYANINRANYDFDDEAFTDISDEAKDFISKLLIKDKEYED
jgi:myosin-light-chain kinase